MTERVRGNYAHTIYASYIGYITQAIVNNFAPLLFLTFASEFGLRLEQITILTTLNFLVQLGADFLMAQLGDRLGTRPCVVAAHFFAAAGLLGLAVLPSVLGYAGLLISVFFYACGGGIIEVLLSPIVENCPTERKEAVMSLLHSFYCWGHVLLVVASTLFFTVFGIGNWRILACIWALVPLFNAFYFMAVPIYPGGSHEPLSMGQLFKQKIFWFFVVVMVCAGASEQAMSQWASSFAESALGVSKTMGDLAGPCAFALLMGTSRALYGKFSEWLPLKGAMAGSAALCILCYVLAAFFGSPVLGLLGCALCGFSVGIFWPGTFSMAAGRLPGGGTAMYGFLSLAGDLGCSAGPTLVGTVAGAAGGRLQAGLAAAIVFPAVILFGLLFMVRRRKAGAARE